MKVLDYTEESEYEHKLLEALRGREEPPMVDHLFVDDPDLLRELGPLLRGVKYLEGKVHDFEMIMLPLSWLESEYTISFGAQ